MRILSWNINGIRTLPQYHPWNTLKTGEAILTELKADIICFQEMKSSRAALERHIALPPSYTGFFSFPATKGGYSGVAVYSAAGITALKAEEGITGCLQPKPPLTPEERIGGYPSGVKMEDKLVPDEQGNVPLDLSALDLEGRGLVVDFGLFVLINVYCPNETSDARLPFKMNYHLALEERVSKLMVEGREVIVLGDINICASPIEHCDGHLPSNRDNFLQHPARRWFHQWLAPQGPMTDIVRQFHPNREGMYTCWNTKIMARETNYGTRVDYILVTPGLLPWIKYGDIQPSLKGSDHCPIYIDLQDSIINSKGQTLELKAEMNKHVPPGHVSPRLASCNWDEYSGKQKLLSSFFGKGKVIKDANPGPTSEVAANVPTAQPPTPPETMPISQPTAVQIPPAPVHETLGPSEAAPVASSSQTNSAKRKKSPINDVNPAASDAYDSVIKKRQKSKGSTPATGSTKNAGKAGQQTLANFFGKPVEAKASGVAKPSKSKELEGQEESDRLLALKLAEEAELPPSQSTLSSAKAVDAEESKAAWSSLFTKTEPPRCILHNEPARAFTVNKAGPNKGRAFFVCARPVGPGYDKGRGERLRTEVDPQYKCDFFVWAADVKRNRSEMRVDGK